MRRAGVNPVVATVILVAIAIVMAIVVGFWASGLVGIFTRFERLEITSTVMVDSDSFNVTVRNTGSVPTAITQVVVNGMAVYELPTPEKLGVGETKRCRIDLNSPPNGVIIEIALQSSGGKTYPTAAIATLGTGAPPYTPTINNVTCT